MKRVIDKIKKLWSEKIVTRIMILNGSIIIISIGFLGLIMFVSEKKFIQDEVILRNQQLATNTAKFLSSELSHLKQDLDLLFDSSLDHDEKVLNLEESAKLILKYRLKYPLTYRSFYLFLNEDLVIHSEMPVSTIISYKNPITESFTPLDDVDPLVLDSFEMIDLSGVYMSDTRFMGIENIPSIIIGIKKEIKGSSVILIAEIDARYLWGRLDELKIGQTGFAYVVSKDGKIISHPNRSYIGTDAVKEVLPVCEGYEGNATYTNRIDGKKYISAYSPVGEQTNWGIVIAQDSQEALSSLQLAMILIPLFLFISLSVALLFNYFVIDSIVKPLKDLRNEVKLIRETGNLDTKVKIKSKDEVGQLALGFNHMIDDLNKSVDELKKLNELMVGRELKMAELKERINTYKNTDNKITSD